MLTKRIIPCLDIKDGEVVKGKSFVDLQNAGDPVELAKRYNKQGADELVFLDITATVEKRKTMIDLVKRVATQIFIPFTVGGGIGSIEDMKALLRAGADKISINSAAIADPSLIQRGAKLFGSQCIVVAIDAKRNDTSWTVFSKGGREETSLDAIEWAKECEALGAGEILLTSIDCDGSKEGFDCKLTNKISSAVNIPVIASGGAGSLESFYDAFSKGNADAALAASLFHYEALTISEVKKYLQQKELTVRL